MPSAAILKSPTLALFRNDPSNDLGTRPAVSAQSIRPLTNGSQVGKPDDALRPAPAYRTQFPSRHACRTKSGGVAGGSDGVAPWCSTAKSRVQPSSEKRSADV